jgi:hypothetical protein
MLVEYLLSLSLSLFLKIGRLRGGTECVDGYACYYGGTNTVVDVYAWYTMPSPSFLPLYTFSLGKHNCLFLQLPCRVFFF